MQWFIPSLCWYFRPLFHWLNGSIDSWIHRAVDSCTFVSLFLLTRVRNCWLCHSYVCRLLVLCKFEAARTVDPRHHCNSSLFHCFWITLSLLECASICLPTASALQIPLIQIAFVPTFLNDYWFIGSLCHCHALCLLLLYKCINSRTIDRSVPWCVLSIRCYFAPLFHWLIGSIDTWTLSNAFVVQVRGCTNHWSTAPLTQFTFDPTHHWLKLSLFHWSWINRSLVHWFRLLLSHRFWMIGSLDDCAIAMLFDCFCSTNASIRTPMTD